MLGVLRYLGSGQKIFRRTNFVCPAGFNKSVVMELENTQP